ncbi:N-acetyltransferase DgcN [Chelativorans sp. M5D2P16]|uniref:N-acetyltransferase DgcN n=1 Tax=Chelativorans sp. M5D2P16 TaxID=3095678 RepID=UPI002ACA753F|nr:N-acetyltransferase DgcN [Chelativorans sp. M5D2P16]MDZ5697169.1 N-acetyltransferase DgcN [Chelativorans sp. M5D2P16]
MLKTPYLLFLGDAPDQLAAKVAQGIKDWRPEFCIGQLRLEGCRADLGLPEMGVEEARAAGAETLVVGAANRGGVISPAWLDTLLAAATAGMDIASGLHNRLTALPELVEAAGRAGTHLFDVRVPQQEYPIAEGRPRTGRRWLAVGTDCSIGKMYTALAMEREMHARGMKASFRATGQTGILITGSGVPLDAVVADFMAGAVEWLTPDNEPDHWDLIEGQGSLFHPSFSGVTMALIHGGRPDALVLCHEPTRTHMRGLPHYSLPSLEALRDLALETARIVNPDVRVTGISVNTAALSAEDAQQCLREIEERMGLPTVDPYRDGAGRLVDMLQ